MEVRVPGKKGFHKHPCGVLWSSISPSKKSNTQSELDQGNADNGGDRFALVLMKRIYQRKYLNLATQKIASSLLFLQSLLFGFPRCPSSIQNFCSCFRAIGEPIHAISQTILSPVAICKLLLDTIDAIHMAVGDTSSMNETVAI